MKSHYKFLVFATLLFTVVFAIENINDRFWLNDFKVYYLATKALLTNEQVYGIPFGLETGFYKYSPFILLLFVPLSLLPFYAASVVQFCIIAVATVACLYIIQRLISEYIFVEVQKPKVILLFFALLCIINHLMRELHMGNINMLIVLLLSSGLFFCLHKKYLPAGVLIGIVILAKPYLIILTLPLLLHKQIKTLVFIASTMVLSFVIMLLFFGVSRTTSLHLEWLKAMMDHGSYLTSNYTITSLVNYYFHQSLSGIVQFYILGLVLLLYSLFFFIAKYYLNTYHNKEREDTFLIAGYFVLLSFIPNILITDTEHFLFSLPLILIAINYLALNKNKIAIGLFVILMLFYLGKSSDIFGSQLSDKIEELGLLGIANIGIIILAVYIIIKSNKSLQSK